MVPVLQQQRAGVGFALAEKLHHPLRVSVAAEKDFGEAVIDVVGVLRRAGVEEALKLAFEAEPVDVHLHVVGHLVRRNARSAIGARALLLLLDVRIEAQALAPLVDETQHRGFQVETGSGAVG